MPGTAGGPGAAELHLLPAAGHHLQHHVPPHCPAAGVPLRSQLYSVCGSARDPDPAFHFHQCCGSGMFIPDPGSWFYPYRIKDPGSRKQHQKRGVKKKICYTFFCSHKFHKIEYYFIFEMLKKKNWANFQRIIEVFTQNFFTKL